MSKKRWALSVPLEGYTLAEHAAIVQQAERLGYSDAWSLEIDGVDAFAPLTIVAQATQMRVGTAIVNVFTRGPATLAISAAGVAESAPGRFCLGVGAGSRPVVEGWNGGHFRRPATRVREMVQFLRQALAGERVTFEGETFAVNGFRLSRPPAQPVPIHVAALRPGMLQVAGQVGDGAILNWLSADDVQKSVRVVHDAAQQDGRDPSSIEITARLFVVVDDPALPATGTFMRRYMAAYLNVPVYKAFQQWLGRGEMLRPMWDAWSAGDRRGALAAIPQQAVDDLLLCGDADTIRAHVRRYQAAGVDTVVLYLLTCETEAVRKQAVIGDAIRALAPGAG